MVRGYGSRRLPGTGRDGPFPTFPSARQIRGWRSAGPRRCELHPPPRGGWQPRDNYVGRLIRIPPWKRSAEAISCLPSVTRLVRQGLLRRFASRKASIRHDRACPGHLRSDAAAATRPASHRWPGHARRRDGRASPDFHPVAGVPPAGGTTRHAPQTPRPICSAARQPSRRAGSGQACQRRHGEGARHRPCQHHASQGGADRRAG